MLVVDGLWLIPAESPRKQTAERAVTTHGDLPAAGHDQPFAKLSAATDGLTEKMDGGTHILLY